MGDKQLLGKVFLELSAIGVYGIWVILFLFPIVLGGVVFLIDESRSIDSLILSSIAIGIVAASCTFRFCLVRNMKSLRSKLLEANNRENAIKIISGGFWWWLVTLICAIAAVILSRSLF